MNYLSCNKFQILSYSFIVVSIFRELLIKIWDSREISACCNRVFDKNPRIAKHFQPDSALFIVVFAKEKLITPFRIFS